MYRLPATGLHAVNNFICPSCNLALLRHVRHPAQRRFSTQHDASDRPSEHMFPGIVLETALKTPIEDTPPPGRRRKRAPASTSQSPKPSSADTSFTETSSGDISSTKPSSSRPSSPRRAPSKPRSSRSRSTRRNQVTSSPYRLQWGPNESTAVRNMSSPLVMARANAEPAASKNGPADLERLMMKLRRARENAKHELSQMRRGFTKASPLVRRTFPLNGPAHTYPSREELKARRQDFEEIKKQTADGSKAAPSTLPKQKKTRDATDKLAWTTGPQAAKIKFVPVEAEQPPVPRLAYGLERILFNRGVYYLQDPRSDVYNFDPYLEEIMPVSEFNFDALRRYFPSSEDQDLTRIARDNKKRYTGSTSSLTTMLSHFHFLLSAWRQPRIDMLSANFPTPHKNFTILSRTAAATVLRYQNGIYAIDADKEFSTSNVLSLLGKSMEKLLTLKKDDYELYRKSNADTATGLAKDDPETFHYSLIGDFVLRSQLDAQDPRLPGTGMFDLKTRAVVAVRMNVNDYENMRDYEIVTNMGEYESYEREYYDLIRAAFLKYSLQVRMGRMDGIFVAYHNTQRIFGFQYIPISEMDYALHGQTDPRLGDMEFRLSMNLLNSLIDKATTRFPEQSLRLHCETRGTEDTAFMYFFAEPVPEKSIDGMQDQATHGQTHLEAAFAEDLSAEVNSEDIGVGQSLDVEDGNHLEHPVLDDVQDASDPELESDWTLATSDSQDDAVTSLEASTTEVPNDEDGVDEEADALSSRPSESGSPPDNISTLESAADASIREDPNDVDGDRSIAEDDEASTSGESDSATATASERSSTQSGELLAFVVRVRNFIGEQKDGTRRRVTRPTNFTPADGHWQLDHCIEEITNPHKKWELYEACKRRRKAVMNRDSDFANSYIRQLRELSRKGKQRRMAKEAEELKLQKQAVVLDP